MPSPHDNTLLPPQLLAQLDRLELVTRKIFRGRVKGERRSRKRGHSVEFADFRNYVPGDDLRFVDWNLYARLDKLFLKVFLEEEDLHFYSLLDTSESMSFGDPTKLRYAKQLAAALGFVALCRGDRVKFDTMSQPLASRSPMFRGRAQLASMLRLLEQFESGGPTTLEVGIKNFCLRNRGNGIVVLITDLMDKQGYESAFRYLLAHELDTYVIHVLAPEELNPDVKGDLKLIDSEDADVAEITVSKPLLDRYQRTVAMFIEDARTFCAKRGMNYLLAPTSIPVEQLVSNYLRRRGLVR